MTEQVFNDYAKYYDLLYKDKDYLAEANYVNKTLKFFDKHIKTILEIGMGTGIHASLLQQEGMQVTGLELSSSMAEKARQKGLECFTANCIDFHLDKKFDAVISLFHVVSYLTQNSDIIRALQNINNHLRRGGVFLFDVWYTPAVYNLKPEVRVKRLNDDSVSITRLAEPVIHWNENVVDVGYEIFIKQEKEHFKINEKHPMRHFSLPELALFAEHTGFNLIHSEEWLSGKSPSENTWGVTCIFKKQN